MSGGGYVVPAYAGSTLDRAGHLRRDPAALRELGRSGSTEIVPLWRDRCLVNGQTVVRLGGAAPHRLPAGVGDPVFLGLRDDRPVFAVDLTDVSEAEALAAVGADRTVDVRALVSGLEPTEAALLGYARGLCYWHRNQRFCGTCGAGNRPVEGGAARTCVGCRQPLFPRISPAVIMLVELSGPPDRCRLGRHRSGGRGLLHAARRLRGGRREPGGRGPARGGGGGRPRRGRA